MLTFQRYFLGLQASPKNHGLPIPELTDAEYLNAQNQDTTLHSNADVVVVGGGIHSLIYAIHARLRSLKDSPDTDTAVTITVLEKSSSPSYKIGESTLTTFGVWLKTIGISTALLWRLFGPKDGLAFYYLPHNGERDGYTDFCANGPAGDFVATLQIERKISELLLTLFAQRLNIQVFHGHSVDINSTQLPKENGRSSGQVHVSSAVGGSMKIDTDLVVDATGRFRQFASKAARITRFPGFNTDAFWAYFEMPGDESEIPLSHYESCHTNHICFAEGWAWVIRLPSWEGSSIPNLVKMINYLLDLNEAKTPSDSYPSSHELASMFDLKFRWVTSIGYALRNDVSYPDNLSTYGSCEAERKFNWITSRYPRMQELMNKHILIKDLYGPKTTWFVRKSLAYQSMVVAGKGWAAIGDATGFTNPLYSPGINCNMGTSVCLAEKTAAYLAAKDDKSRQAILNEYTEFCSARIPHLHRMNVFNYLTMRSPQTGPLGPLWQYLCGTGNAEWQRIKEFADFDRVAELVTQWEWGAQRPEFVTFAEKVIHLLDGPPTEPSVEAVNEVSIASKQMIVELLETKKFKSRWAGLLRYYNDELVFSKDKVRRDILAARCDGCANWRILTGEAILCPTCGARNALVVIQRYN